MAQKIRQLLPTNCSSVFDHFVELALKGLSRLVPGTYSYDYWDNCCKITLPEYNARTISLYKLSLFFPSVLDSQKKKYGLRNYIYDSFCHKVRNELIKMELTVYRDPKRISVVVLWIISPLIFAPKTAFVLKQKATYITISFHIIIIKPFTIYPHIFQADLLHHNFHQQCIKSHHL